MSNIPGVPILQPPMPIEDPGHGMEWKWHYAIGKWKKVPIVIKKFQQKHLTALQNLDFSDSVDVSSTQPLIRYTGMIQIQISSTKLLRKLCEPGFTTIVWTGSGEKHQNKAI